MPASEYYNKKNILILDMLTSYDITTQKKIVVFITAN